jgi:hypothetical protein
MLGGRDNIMWNAVAFFDKIRYCVVSGVAAFDTDSYCAAKRVNSLKLENAIRSVAVRSE